MKKNEDGTFQHSSIDHIDGDYPMGEIRLPTIFYPTTN